MNAYIFRTWIALPEEFSGIVQGKANDDDFGFVDTQPGFVDGQGLIFLQKHNIFSNGLTANHEIWTHKGHILTTKQKRAESLNIQMKISVSHFSDPIGKFLKIQS